MKKYLSKKLQDGLIDMLGEHKRKQDLNWSPTGASSIEVSRTTARAIMARFTPKNARHNQV